MGQLCFSVPEMKLLLITTYFIFCLAEFGEARVAIATISPIEQDCKCLFTEFFCTKKAEVPFDQRAQWILDICDTDVDGQVSIQEWMDFGVDDDLNLDEIMEILNEDGCYKNWVWCPIT